MPNISVIIPAFNAADTLTRCVESVLAQSVPACQVLIVDDGSTDDTGPISRDLASRFPSVQVLRQQQAGVSAARNAGIEAARGDYLLFVDSDDWIDERCLSGLLGAASASSADVVGFEYSVDADERSSAVSSHPSGALSPEEAVGILLRTPNRFAWSRLYRRSAVGPVRFRRDIRWGEDTLFVCQVLTRSSRAHHLDVPFYHYVQTPGSATRSGFNAAKATGVVVTTELLALVGAEFPQFLGDAHAFRIGVLCELVFDLYQDGSASGRLARRARRLLICSALSPLRAGLAGRVRAAGLVAGLSPALYARARGRRAVAAAGRATKRAGAQR